MTEPQIPPALAAFLTTDLPEPLKALAGIAVSAVEETRDLPHRIGSLPTSLVTMVASKSLRVQQQYADWVAKGEDFLSSLSEPADDIPEWATFDEDLPRPPAADMAAAATVAATVADLEPAPGSWPGEGAAAPAKKVPPVKKSAPAKKTAPAKKSAPAKTAPPAKRAPATVTDASVTPATTLPTKLPTHKGPAKKSPAKKAPAKKAPTTASSADAVAPLLPPRRSAPATRTGPEVMPEFDTLTIPQLRARLKTLKVDELRELVEHEQGAGGRKPIINMLQARIETLTS
ncbi:lipid droplet-associated protein [Epidermidibacterium keratini]|uniref:Lipid droplet-associated protein n=1 Tax=Epidermidibacterium keratini TaxID=1891644 RepID=A0A7L4YKL8_9ACTN|nr:lipid droplet-associated protein [Epidermidibacterium keratini]QHB99679.1 lipid droplet-associated protein [Epidermidibacterium keratini]